jgi:hypothetical protein
MRKVFINKSVVPPGDFVYVEPSSGIRFRTRSWNTMVLEVREHRIANGVLLSPGWEDELESDVCKNYGPETCKFVDSTPDNGPRSIHVSDVKNFLRVLGSWMTSGTGYVEQEEAERRAEICAACPKNQTIEGCTACSNLVGTISAILGSRATKYDVVLKGCAVCSCSNQAQVHIPLDVLKKGVTQNMEFPDHCWKK